MERINETYNVLVQKEVRIEDIYKRKLEALAEWLKKHYPQYEFIAFRPVHEGDEGFLPDMVAAMVTEGISTYANRPTEPRLIIRTKPKPRRITFEFIREDTSTVAPEWYSEAGSKGLHSAPVWPLTLATKRDIWKIVEDTQPCL